MQKEERALEMSFLLSAVFRDHCNSAARVVSNSAYPVATAAKAPVALDLAECPGAVVGSLVPPWTTEEIIPAQLQPTRTSVAGRVGPGVLQPLTYHLAGDASGAAVGVSDNSRNAGTALGKYYFGIAKTIPGCPPFAIDVAGRTGCPSRTG